jgi:hypothetical protein
MIHLLHLTLLIAGLIVSATAGATWCHFAERIHWHRLAQTWYDDGYNQGWHTARQYYGTMVPEVTITRDGQLAVANIDSGDQLAEADCWETLLIKAQDAGAPAGVAAYLP